jgi:acetylornithine deacetylase (EC 3.5.1.16)/N2-acetyl-L-lysine deacetylase (EC 3.5.1.-)
MAVEFRIPPDRTASGVKELADGALETGTVNWQDAVDPVFESPRTPVARAFRAAIRAADGEPRMLRKTGTSDMNVYATAWDCPIVSYGPGDSALDHAPDERLPLSAYDRAVGALETAMERLV